MSAFSSSRSSTRRGLAHVRLAVGAALGDHRLDLLVLARMQRLEREILELPLERVDAEPVRERRVDLERLLRRLHLLLLAEVLDRAHVVQAVRELDQDHARVLGHRHDHLAVVLGLGLLAASGTGCASASSRPRRAARSRSPNSARSSSISTSVSSTTSCSSAAATVSSSRRSSAKILATDHGWRMNSSPDRRCWPSCAFAAKAKALASAARGRRRGCTPRRPRAARRRGLCAAR